MSCSGVGPERGYTKSVRTAVCVNGAEIELTEIADGELRLFRFEVEGRDIVRWIPDDDKLNTEPEPEWDGRWPVGERRPNREAVERRGSCESPLVAVDPPRAWLELS